jgi:phenylalanyl-tRNA synthetase beta chain
MKFLLDWIGDYVDVAAAGGADGVRRLLEQAGLPTESVEETPEGIALDVEITPNRPDAMSHVGLAREIAALSGFEPVTAPVPAALREAGEAAEHLTSVVIQVPRLCRRFGALLLRGISNGASPDKVRRRLAAIGAKPISAAVDATNYALWDRGQPLHAFDFDELAGGLLIVRKARRGEKLVTLDGVERELSPSDVVVADAERAVSLAGIMGGLTTAVTEKTRNVLLEGAWWDPVTIRRTARRLSLHTDASHRFERGADVESIPGALALAARLIVEAAGGAAAPGLLDAHGANLRVRRSTLRLARLKLVSGDDRLTLGFAADALRRLGFDAERRGKHLAVAIPLFRPDVRHEDDLVEEVLRVYGYDRLPSRLPPTIGGGGYLEPLREAEDRLSDAAAAAGLFETIAFPFVDPEEQAPFAPWLAASGADGAGLSIANPLDERRPRLRATLIPGVLDAAAHNVRRGQRDTALFEVGRGFGRPGDSSDPASFESRRLALAVCGEARPHWSVPPEMRRADFFDAKGLVEQLVEPWLAPGSAAWTPFEAPGFTPGAAAIARTPEGKVLAVAGRVGAGERERRRLTDSVFAAEIVIDSLPRRARVRFEAYSAYPAVEADVSFGHERELSWAAIEELIERRGLENLESVRVLDRYEGEGVPAGRVKTTARLIFRSTERSLTTEETRLQVDALLNTLRDELGVQI